MQFFILYIYHVWSWSFDWIFSPFTFTAITHLDVFLSSAFILCYWSFSVFSHFVPFIAFIFPPLLFFLRFFQMIFPHIPFIVSLFVEIIDSVFLDITLEILICILVFLILELVCLSSLPEQCNFLRIYSSDFIPISLQLLLFCLSPPPNVWMLEWFEI